MSNQSIKPAKKKVKANQSIKKNHLQYLYIPVWDLLAKKIKKLSANQQKKGIKPNNFTIDHSTLTNDNIKVDVELGPIAAGLPDVVKRTGAHHNA